MIFLNILTVYKNQLCISIAGIKSKETTVFKQFTLGVVLCQNFVGICDMSDQRLSVERSVRRSHFSMLKNNRICHNGPYF